MDQGAVPNPSSSVEELAFELEALAIKELRRRLKDPVARMQLPGTGLLNLVLGFQKQREPGKDKLPEPVELDVLEIVAGADLPDARKRELLNAELGQVEARRESLTRALEEEDEPTGSSGSRA